MEKGISGRIIKIMLFLLLFLAATLYLIMEFAPGLIGQGLISPVSGAIYMEEVATPAEYAPETHSVFYTGKQGGYFYATKDGVTCYGSDHHSKSASSFNMTAPILTGNGNCTAIWEHMGNTVSIFSDQGLLYQKQLEESILHVSVNPKGYSNIITKNNDQAQGQDHDRDRYRYRIDSYNPSGTLILGGPDENYNIFPFTSAISNDGRILAVSYVDVNGVTPDSIIQFSYLNISEGRDYADGVFAAIAKNPDEMISQLHFMDDNKLLVVSDKQIACVDVNQNPSAYTWSIPLGNKLLHLAIDEGKGFTIALGDPILNQPSVTPNLIQYYTMDQTLQWSYEAKAPISLINVGFNGVLVVEAGNVTALQKGQPIWQYPAPQDLRQIFFYQSLHQVLQVTDTKASILSAVKASVQASGAPSTPLPGSDTALPHTDTNIDSTADSEPDLASD